MQLHKNIRLLSLHNFFTDFRLYAPVAILYFSSRTGSYALGMSIFAITMVSSALFEIPTGICSDRVGRRKTVIFGSLAAVSYAVMYAVGSSYAVLAAGAALEGLSRAFYSGNNDAFLHDTLAQSHDEHRYDEFLGRTSAMFQAALAVSAIAGGIIAGWSFAWVMWLSVIPQCICLCISFLLSEPNTHIHESGNVYAHLAQAYRNFFSNGKLRLLSLSSVLGYGFGETSFQFQSAFYASLWPVWAIGIAKTLSNTGGMISYHFSGRLIRKFGNTHILFADNLYSRCINTVSTAFPSVLSPLFMSTTSLFFGVADVARNSLMQREFTAHERATMGSLNSFAGSLFFGVVSVLLGFTADRFSPAQALLVLQVFMLANLFIYRRLFRGNGDARRG